MPEAFAGERPVVAAHVGGLPELVAHDRTGWLAEPGDWRDFALWLRLIATRPDDVARVTIAARQLAEAELRLEAKMQATLAAYREAMARTRAGRIASEGRPVNAG